MSYQFSQDEMRVIGNSDFKENKFIFPKNKGYYNMKKRMINDDVIVFKNDVYAKEDLKLNQISNSITVFSDILYINLILDGIISVNIDNHKSFLYEKSKTIIYSLENITGNFQMQKDTKFSSLGIVLARDFFEKNDLNFDELKKTSILKNAISNPKSHTLANEAFSSPFDNNLETIYLQSKILEIIYLELLSLKQTPKTRKVKFSDMDIDALEKAKHILETSLKCPSIQELSRMVALNDFKLKHGFKKFFNQSPYQISLSYRMQIAKKLLEKGDLNATEISKKIDYKNPQSFSLAFYKHFGIRPKDVRKVRKFYI